MRGSPLLQAILVIVVFALAGVPVWRLTRAAETGAAAAPAIEKSVPAAKTVSLDVEATFAPAPVDFQIKNLDRIVLAGHGPESRFTTRWTTAVPPEGVDLVVQAHWTAGPGAARVTVRFPDGREVEKSVWATTDVALAEVVTVPGVPPPPAP